MAFLVYVEKSAVTPVVANLQVICSPTPPSLPEDLHFDFGFQQFYNNKLFFKRRAFISLLEEQAFYNFYDHLYTL